MKYLAETKNGHAVELSRSEYSSLVALAEAVEGNKWDWSKATAYHETQLSREMDDAFKAVRAFIAAKFAVNELSSAVGDLEFLLGELEK